MKLRVPWTRSRPAPGRQPEGAHPDGKGARRDAVARRDAGGRSGRILTAKIRRAQGRMFPWRNAVIYGALVVAAGLGIAAWDRAYESQFKAPPPNVRAKSLIENFIGPGTVHSASIDGKARTADMTVEDVLITPGQSKADERQNLTREGALIIGIVQNQMKDLKVITVHLVKAGRPLATARVEGDKTPTTEFAPDLR